MQNGNENWIRLLVLFAKTSSQGYYLAGVLFLPFRTGCISKCVLTAEVTLSGPLVLGAVCLHLPWYLQMPGKTGKLFSVPGLQGKLGLTISAMLIATSLLESWNSASLLGLRDEKGRGKSLCACVNKGTAARHTDTHVHMSSVPIEVRCAVIKPNLGVQLLIMWIIWVKLQTPSMKLLYAAVLSPRVRLASGPV